ncbi:DNA endonuclease SmrA [Paraglaciecola aquimarina]|uniref:DNA endonuclease SmrA n=1 Tax=Paraglaciecola algarum TaxID=3050085 RepID=A0ABS9DCA8_9ALTE|nr:DNA endonuclease SmrA [Paraglaciecola sp. G1-23]MCF2949980.1 DNA endonuclease SmrA [Paraglaciecola sp. G1-23]
MGHSNHKDDFDEFLNEFKDVIPLKNTQVVQTTTNKNALAKQLKRQAIELEQQQTNNYLTTGDVKPIDPYDYLSFKQNGIQDGVFKNLRLGKYKIDTVLNLQQLKFEQARTTVFNQVQQAHAKGRRTLLIKHGLGLHSKPFPAMLKSYLNQWLIQMPEIIAFHTAQIKHGGNLAVYALLKKNQEQKLHNRETYGQK